MLPSPAAMSTLRSLRATMLEIAMSEMANGGSLVSDDTSVTDILRAAGLLTLGDKPPPDAIEAAVRNVTAALNGADPARREAARAEIVAIVKPFGWRAAAIDAVLAPPKAHDNGGRPLEFDEIEPWPEPVDGAELLEGLSTWIRRYAWVPQETGDATATWAVLTWFVDVVYFAPVLAILSATKRCAKTLVLDLLEFVVCRGTKTSGPGITAAVVFRLNDTQQPTFLIDEAEKLSSVDDSREIIGLLNAGYRRGAKVHRCDPNTLDVLEFDAFGFRTVAAIKDLWDTLIDRSVVLRMERRPKDAKIDQFNARRVKGEARERARKIARWAGDVRDRIADAEEQAPRPGWLNDRACDNWSGMFAVAAVAGGEWPERIEAAARKLAGQRDDASDGERLLRDVALIFEAEKDPETKTKPEIITSTALVTKLNALEDAPWPDRRKGNGITPHWLAATLKSFGIEPHHNTTKTLRGYHLKDLELAWTRYEVSVVSNDNDDNGLGDDQSVRNDAGDGHSEDDLSASDNKDLDTTDTLERGGSGSEPDFRCAAGCGRSVGGPGITCAVCRYGEAA